ncbi:MAG: DUF5668 domain-containing protein [Mucilaginibacter sp.]|uniref:LiaF transmembrane domain-containing protein n=1 Tax=Mucilaginibacter sp. TaxID=1882438 RepID=UPI0032633F6F
MQNDIEQQPIPGRNNGKVIAGFILLVIGGGLLLQQLGAYILPYWIFSWPMFLIVIGLYSGAKHNFRKPMSYILFIIGVLFLLDDIFPDVNFHHMFWPILIISAGLLMILNRNHQWDNKRFGKGRRNRWSESDKWEQNQQYNWDKKVNPDNPTEPIIEEPADTTSYTSTEQTKTAYGKTYKGYPVEDYLDATSIFGSANKTIFTKTFRGGEIVNIFGGAEIDFTQSDISGQVVIDVTQIFGGIKLLVPPHWHVTSDTVSLFAGFDDKRKQKNLTGDKVLMITGTSIFAGIEIRSY